MFLCCLLVGVLLAGAWTFTAVHSRRIERRFPLLGSTVEIGGGAIHLIDLRPLGKERGVVLMIHGASGNAADLAVALGGRLVADGLRVLSVDRPGHGWSDRVGGRHASWAINQAKALRRAANALGVQQAVVVAHSLGGVAALAMALEEADFVRALVLIAAVTHPWPGGVAWYYHLGAHSLFGAPFRRLVTLPVGMAWMNAAIAGVFAPNAAPSDFIESTRLPLVLRPSHFRANCEDIVFAEAAVAAMASRYGEIQAPTEVVTGDSDHIVSATIHSHGVARDIKFSRLTVLGGVGHAPHHVAPARIAALILNAFQRAQTLEDADEETSQPADGG